MMTTKGPWTYTEDARGTGPAIWSGRGFVTGVSNTYNLPEWKDNIRLMTKAPQLKATNAALVEACEFALGTSNDSETRAVLTEAIRQAKEK